MHSSPFQALLLGNDAQLAEALLPAVRSAGGHLAAVATFAEARRLLPDHPPELAFLDLTSAGTDSLNLLPLLQQPSGAALVYTIGLGSAADTATALRAFELGLNDFLRLPLEERLFPARLKAALQLQRGLADSARRQQAMLEASRAAEANSRAKSEFLATMSHEIRTPMNGVIAMTGLLMDTPLTADQRSYLETIYHSSESLLSIINDILDFSKIEAGKMELERRPFDLRHCVEESLDLLAPRALEKNLDLACDLADAIPELVEGDTQRLRQVLVNLVGNALKFTEAGGVMVQVESLLSPPADAANPRALRLHFAVRDSGIGIPADRLARLFRPFSQGDSSTSRKYGGTGLGLVISRRLVELMGGRMWAESVAGEGSTFHFTISLSAAADSAPPAHARPQPHLAGLRILILEDNAMLRNLLSDRCRRWGLRPQSVENTAQMRALLLQGQPFDLALVDTALPGADGAAVAAELQRLPQAAGMPVVFMTALGKKDGAMEAGVKFAQTVTKPVRPAQLCAALERSRLSAPTPEAPPATAKPGTAPAPQQPLRILLVDDNAINQKVAVRILQQLGYQPVVAGNGREALDAIVRQPFDLVFMDVMMPEMDGLEATRQIRRRQMAGDEAHFQSGIVVVAMTAHAMQGDRETCLAAGMDDYLSKPVRPKDLKAMIEKWAGTFALRADAAPEAAAGATPAVEPPVDLARMTDLTDGNQEALRELVEMYFNQTRTQLAQMQDAIRDANPDQVRRLAHSCAGASATLGMTHLVPRLRELERLGASGSLTAAGGIWETAGQEFERIRAYLQAQPEIAPVFAKLAPA